MSEVTQLASHRSKTLDSVLLSQLWAVFVSGARSGQPALGSVVLLGQYKFRLKFRLEDAMDEPPFYKTN